MNADGWTIVVAAYAAIVATGALFLEVRRWFESGPSLRTKVMSEALVYGTYAFGADDEEPIIYVSVTNSGDLATSITHLTFVDYEDLWHWIRRKPKYHAFVHSPSIGGSETLPAKISPGDIWAGGARYDDNLRERRDRGCPYVQVIASHRTKPYSMKLTKPADLGEATASKDE